MSAKAGMKRRREAALLRKLPKHHHRTSNAAAAVSGTFAGKISKTAKKSGGR